jgi:hypothetical protein
MQLLHGSSDVSIPLGSMVLPNRNLDLGRDYHQLKSSRTGSLPIDQGIDCITFPFQRWRNMCLHVSYTPQPDESAYINPKIPQRIAMISSFNPVSRCIAYSRSKTTQRGNASGLSFPTIFQPPSGSTTSWALRRAMIPGFKDI